VKYLWYLNRKVSFSVATPPPLSQKFTCDPPLPKVVSLHCAPPSRFTAPLLIIIAQSLSMESDSQGNQRNQTEVLVARTTLKRRAASSEQTKKTNVSTARLHFGPHPVSSGLHVKTSFSSPRVGGEVSHILVVPRFNMNRNS